MKRRPAAFTFYSNIFAALMIASCTHASVSLNWEDNSSNEAGFSIERSADGIRFREVARVPADVVRYTDPDAKPGGTFHYRVSAFNAFGHSGYTNTAAAVVESASEAIDKTLETLSSEADRLLFDGQLLSTTDLATASSSTFSLLDIYHYYESMGLHLLSSYGSGMGELGDEFNFAYVPTDPNCQIIARVPFHAWRSAGSQCGIMIRSSLSSDSAYAAALLSSTGKTQAQWRSAHAGSAQSRELLGSHPIARYLKIRRRGSYCWLSASRDGYQWSPSSKVPVTLGSDALIGLFVASSQNTNSMALLEVLESTEPTLAPSLSYYRGSRKQRSIGLQSSQTSSSLDRATGLYKLTANGRGFESYHDQLNFNYWVGEDSCRIVARIHAFVGDGSNARTGLSLRSSLETNAAIAAVTLNENGKIETLTRSREGGKVYTQSGQELPDGCYLALERQGNTVSYHWSANGVDWNRFGTHSLDLPSIHHVGLTLGSHDGESASLLELIGLY